MIYKSLTTDYTDKDIEKKANSGTMQHIDFDMLPLFTINQLVRLKENERIIGLVISQDSIKVKIENKKKK